MTSTGSFEASEEGAALGVVTLSAGRAPMIVLEPSLKPADLSRSARRRSQPALPGFQPEGPAPRLRVRKSFSYQLPFLPRHKSIGDSTPLASVLTDGAADHTGGTVIVPRRY